MNIQKILIAVDDSKYSDKAAAYGFELAQFYKAHVGLVNIVEPIMTGSSDSNLMMGTPFEGSMTNDAELIRVQQEASENLIQRIIKNFADGLQVTHFTQYGSKAESIIDCSNEFGADLIVIGTHNRTGLDRLLMGSVAGHVVRHSEVPVLVVPFKEESGS